MLKNRLIYAAVLIGVFLFHCYYTGWLSWFLLMFLLLLPPFSLLCSLPCILRQQVVAQLPASCKRGEEVLLQISNRQRTRLPAPPCSLRLRCADRLAGTELTQEYRFAAWDHRDIPLQTAHCGAYTYTFLHGRITDYLGIFSFRLRLPELGTLRVLPLTEKPEPLPNLSRFQTRSYRPKPGGGFSEVHDLREYRPGDSMRDIHWKLSAKTDELIVREAQEPNRGQVLLTFDLRGTRGQVDETLDLLNWMSRWLLAHETAHFACWLRPSDLEPETMELREEQDLDKLMEKLLDTPLREDMPSIAGRSFAAADWRYHIRLPEEGVRA